jgi:hypothetical protein
MSSITIHRKSHYVNFFRSIKIYIDDEFVAKLSDNETKKIDLTPGEHSLEAKIDWRSSNKIIFNVQTGEEIKMELGSSVFNSTQGILLPILRFLILILGAYISSRYNNNFFFLITVLILVSWYIAEVKRKKGTSMVFYLTSGRKQYLYLKRL